MLLSHSDENDEQQFRVAFTNDAGTTWSSSAQIRTAGQRSFGGGGSLYFLDSVHGWMALDVVTGMAHGRRLLFTLDGGKTWRYTPAEPGPAGGMCFFNDKDGIFTGEVGTGDYDQAYVTHDGSRSWQTLSLKGPPQASPATYPAYGEPICMGGQRGLIPVTFSGPEPAQSALSLFATDDGGRSWRLDRTLFHLDGTAAGERVPSTVGGSALIAAPVAFSRRCCPPSVKGETRWAVIGSAGEATNAAAWPLVGVLGLSFVDASEGWANTSGGLFSTMNGGVSWTEITPTEKRRSALPPRERNASLQTR